MKLIHKLSALLLCAALCCMPLAACQTQLPVGHNNGGQSAVEGDEGADAPSAEDGGQGGTDNEQPDASDDPVQTPEEPTESEEPDDPVEAPEEPIEPDDPVQTPEEPAEPEEPDDPVETPEKPVEPVEPDEPTEVPDDPVIDTPIPDDEPDIPGEAVPSREYNFSDCRLAEIDGGAQLISGCVGVYSSSASVAVADYNNQTYSKYGLLSGNVVLTVGVESTCTLTLHVVNLGVFDKTLVVGGTSYSQQFTVKSPDNTQGLRNGYTTISCVLPAGQYILYAPEGNIGLLYIGLS